MSDGIAVGLGAIVVLVLLDPWLGEEVFGDGDAIVKAKKVAVVGSTQGRSERNVEGKEYQSSNFIELALRRSSAYPTFCVGGGQREGMLVGREDNQIRRT